MLEAPWTAEQVDALNDYQRNGHFHPFTCGGDRNNDEHRAAYLSRGDRDHGLLIATQAGWRCPACDYQQSWAHAFMFAGAGEDPVRRFFPEVATLAEARLGAKPQAKHREAQSIQPTGKLRE